MECVLDFFVWKSIIATVISDKSTYDVEDLPDFEYYDAYVEEQDPYYIADFILKKIE